MPEKTNPLVTAADAIEAARLKRDKDLKELDENFKTVTEKFDAEIEKLTQRQRDLRQAFYASREGIDKEFSSAVKDATGGESGYNDRW